MVTTCPTCGVPIRPRAVGMCACPPRPVVVNADDCPQWRCPHVSVHDRREGKTCAECDPCNCDE